MRLVWLLCIAIVGCAPHGQSETQQVDQTPAEFRQAQLDRTSTFENLEGRGVIELKWIDDDGKHKEQGDLDFWKNGESISLRISKMGELLMWFGGKGEDYWLFDMMGDEPTLTIGGESALFSDIEIALILLGLQPLPEGTLRIEAGEVTLVDLRNRIWKASFDPVTHRPLEMTIESSREKVFALHRKGIRVELENTHELHWPFSGGLIDVKDARGDREIKFAFSSLSTIVNAQRLDRVCSLDYLRNALNPTVIQQGQEP